MTADFRLPEKGSKAPYVIERVRLYHDRHGPTSSALYLAPGGKHTLPRWVTFGEAKKFRTAREAVQAARLVAQEVDEQWTIFVHSWNDVFARRGQPLTPEQTRQKLIEDFLTGTDPERAEARLYLIGCARLAERTAQNATTRDANATDWQKLEPSSTTTVADIAAGRGLDFGGLL